MGDDLFNSQEFRERLSEYEQAVNTGQPVFMDADELAEIADYYRIQEQPDEAEAAIRLALSLSPGAIAPLTYRIHEALYNNDVEAAKEYLSQITETDEPDYIYDQAEVMLAEGKTDEADAFLREQFKTVPPDEYQDYVLDVADLYQDWGLSDKAMEWLSRSKPENTPDFKELMARTLFGLGKYKDSAKLFNELIDTDPYQKRYWNALASAQFMSEDYSEAIQSSEYAIAIDPNDAEGLISKANALYRLSNYEEALKYYQRYSELLPDDDYSWLHQGTCQINLGHNEQALELLQKALDVAADDSPYLADIYQELAFIQSERGNTDLAIELLNKTDELECDHIQLTVIKGHILLAGKRIEEAGDYFQQAVKDSNNAPQTLMRIIVSLYDNKYVEAAYKMFLKFFDIVDDNYTEGYAYMALCCYDLQKYDEFLKYLKTACQLNPKECRLVLSHLFPSSVKPEDYYEYIKEGINNKLKEL